MKMENNEVLKKQFSSLTTTHNSATTVRNMLSFIPQFPIASSHFLVILSTSQHIF